MCLAGILTSHKSSDISLLIYNALRLLVKTLPIRILPCISQDPSFPPLTAYVQLFGVVVRSALTCASSRSFTLSLKHFDSAASVIYVDKDIQPLLHHYSAFLFCSS